LRSLAATLIAISSYSSSLGRGNRRSNTRKALVLQERRPRAQQQLTVSGDLPPGVGWVHEGSVVDLVGDVLVLVEGEGAAQADVHDDAHRPHVQRAVVALGAQHLGRQVRRRAHHRAAERLLADDAGEAEVAEFHLPSTLITVT